jgi:hypothetical protein
VIIAEFPSYELAKAYYDDPAHQEAREFALKASKRDLLLTSVEDNRNSIAEERVVPTHAIEIGPLSVQHDRRNTKSRDSIDNGPTASTISSGLSKWALAQHDVVTASTVAFYVDPAGPAAIVAPIIRVGDGQSRHDKGSSRRRDQRVGRPERHGTTV